MALPIKDVPVLTGDIAADFIRKAEERSKGKRKNPDPDKLRGVMSMVERSQSFVPSWRR